MADRRGRASTGLSVNDRTASLARSIVISVSTVPITAMPSAAPIWRTVVLAPLAEPTRSGSISERTTFVSWELAKPMPMPKTTKPGSSDQKVRLRRDHRDHDQQPDRLEREPDAHDGGHADVAGQPSADLRADDDEDPRPAAATARSATRRGAWPSWRKTGSTKQEAELAHREHHRGGRP